jgi:hypothetical protein
MEPITSIVEKIISEYNETQSYLIEHTQLTILTNYSSNLTKVLVLSITSYYEKMVTDLIHRVLNNNKIKILDEFLDQKALFRQYHTLFDWDRQNVNKFYSLFGDSFKKYMNKVESEDLEYLEGSKSFIKLGSLRNQLVHDNFFLFTVESTIDDINKDFVKAMYFLDKLEKIFREYARDDTQLVI